MYSCDLTPCSTNSSPVRLDDYQIPTMSVTIFHRHPQRAEALNSGDLIDVTEIAREDSFQLPTAITRRAWESAIEPQSDDAIPALNLANSDRVRELIRTAENQIRRRWDEELTRLTFTAPGHGECTSSRRATLIIVATTDNAGKPALTIGLPEEFGSR